MDWLEVRLSDGRAYIDRLLAHELHAYADLKPTDLPEQAGIYAITEMDAPEGVYLYAGRASLGPPTPYDRGLRRRLYREHLYGQQTNSLSTKLQLARKWSRTAAQQWIRANCGVRWVEIPDWDTLIWGEHFVLGMLRPTYADGRQSRVEE